MESQDDMISFVTSAMDDPAPYYLLTSVVAPRPIAWVSTISSSGIPNLAPYSFFNAVSGFPPTITFSVSHRRQPPIEKDTLKNIREIGEFVCHVTDEALSEAMVKTAASWPADVSEFDATGLDASPSIDVRPPRVCKAPVAMECVVTQIVPVEGANSTMVLGRILRFHIRTDLYRADLGLVDTIQMKPVTRLGGPDEYSTIGQKFSLKIPEI